ncbi:MAG: hypothetical protein ACE366_12060 [Bradymonadia bacterium]
MTHDHEGPFAVTPRPISGLRVDAWALKVDQRQPSAADHVKLRMIAWLVEAVSRGHTLGLAHGDLLSPHLTIISDGTPRLTAFGVREGDAADDVRALGALALSLLTGESPSTVLHGTHGTWLDATESLDLPLEALFLIEKMTEAEPESRPTAAALAPQWADLAGSLVPTPRRWSAPSGPTAHQVHIVDAALQHGPITDRPSATMFEQCHQAASSILEQRPELRDHVEAVYLGTMGLSQGSPLHATHIPNALRARLGLTGIRGDGYHTHMSTSESGAVALLKAVRDLQSGRRTTVLVVAAEAMFSGDPEHRRAERAEISAWIKSVVDPGEGAYDLSMLNIGDLIMDHLIWASGLPPEDWREVLRDLTLGKYARASVYPQAMEAAKARRRGPITPETYADARQNRPVTPHYRLHDVCPNANGATALVLSTDPALASGVQILGMGEGHTKVALTERTDPLGRPAAMRRALRQLCHDAEVDPALLLDAGHTVGIFHDAFPAIEASALAELDPTASWSWRLDRLKAGWTNALGGLSAAGHALGNSGLLQIAQAFHLLTDDPRYLEALPEVAQGRSFVLTTSVGAALTNVVSTLVGRLDDGAQTQLSRARAAYDKGTINARWRRPAGDPMVDDLLAACGPGEGIVIARTHVPHDDRWVHLVRTTQETVLAICDAGVLPCGARVKVFEGTPRRISL